MNLYSNLKSVQRSNLENINVKIENDKDYTVEEINEFERIVSSHLFSVSKNVFPQESLKFVDTLNTFEKYKSGLQN